MDFYLDKVQADIIEEVEKLNAKDVSLQKKLQEECESLENELEEFQSKLDQYSEKVNQLFATSKLAQKRLKQCQEVNQNIASRSQINICKFEPSKDMTAFKTNHSPLGMISTHIKRFPGPSRRSIIEMEAHLVEKMNAQVAKDDKCWITGMAMVSFDDILLADCENSSLKILNVSNCKVKSRIKPPGKPWDVTVINSEKAATTLPEEGKILFVSTNNGLSESHSLKVRYGCAGIDHHSSKIAVSFYSPPAIQVLGMKGHILHEVSDTSIFKSPYYICMSNDNEGMFVSDVGKHSVYELKIDEELKTTIKSESLTYPAGLVMTTNGTVVVCGRKRVNMIVPGTSEILPLMQEIITASILVCEEQNKMYISKNLDKVEASFIKIFDLK
ncbi:uncharacterized protein LOC128546950 [Mercenaria mercenaria]|uniref:uncharacterized protein LOC128546950 n=1 Tax=Mercenaria mercenaria TaxID=6596 RepID=UPI00234F425E|nr:uncharacterized protein LOC128546950 [Mercenaria mercenaria]